MTNKCLCAILPTQAKVYCKENEPIISNAKNNNEKYKSINFVKLTVGSNCKKGGNDYSNERHKIAAKWIFWWTVAAGLYRSKVCGSTVRRNQDEDSIVAEIIGIYVLSRRYTVPILLQIYQRYSLEHSSWQGWLLLLHIPDCWTSAIWAWSVASCLSRTRALFSS